ncbi:hypothetical protein [Microbacterium sp. Leaf320]|uniref:hypothetical protein n=1 Tax=Microbacterium sp. Leaf320 TaxID=1736334 RepID=UPI0006F56F65|nr:hypothetical protein [Microbacterium sp. Leaf320]KQQ65195.1 hypothetical protein ASF63_14655 [Microbacterium sp. Leaf320]
MRLITATIKVGTVDYTEEIQDFSYDPTSAIVEVTDVSGKVHKLAGESGYNLTLNVFQNFAASGFARKCFDDEGKTAEITIVDGPITWTSTITLVAPKIGGATKQVGISPVVFGSTRPVPAETPAG